MSMMKRFVEDRIYELNKEGYTIKEIAITLNVSEDFVKAYIDED